MKPKLFLTGLSLLLGVLFLSSQTYIKQGPVSGIWTKDQSPYLIQGKIIIPHGKTLKIEPGVEIIFETIKGLQVHGRLLAEGTDSNRITFTASDPEKGWSGVAWDGNLMNDLKHEQGSRVNYCTFRYCKDFGEYQVNSGGAIRVLYTDNVKINHCIFEFNESRLQTDDLLSGGAITLTDADISISHCIFRYNTARYGGALLIKGNTQPIIDNCLFYNNFSVCSGATIALIDHAYPYFINCTFSDNYAIKNGGVFYISDYSRPILNNCILWGNSATNQGDQVYFKGAKAGLSAFNCDIEGGQNAFEGTPFIVVYNNNIDKDPMLTQTPGQKYRLSAFSPCLDIACSEGDQLPEGWQCPCEDLASNKRISGCNLDLGCYEYQVVTDPQEEGDPKTTMIKKRIYPQPVQSTATIVFNLENDADLLVRVFNLSGKNIATLVNNQLPSGEHQITWDASSLPNGLYFIQTTTDQSKYVDKVLVNH